MQQKLDGALSKHAGVNRPPLGFPTTMQRCSTCGTVTPHQLRGFANGESVRICVSCLERALRPAR